MYRYVLDNAITYTSEDVVLFRESPFACWMERLTLENPGHGIPADRGSQPPANTMQRQDDIAETLRAEGKSVRLIDWDEPEPQRRTATLQAMRHGADFIVNGQLALGPLSGSANLLMRTSGYSELGDYLYIPCDTQAKTTLQSTFRLCFLADLLHSLQGQLPPQMLIIRGGSDVIPLQTEDHIYHYRAVKQRFMQSMRDFRKHRMPDPAESSHFGRWSDCALEVLKQRALGAEEEQSESAEIDTDIALPQAATAEAFTAGSAYDMDEVRGPLDGVAPFTDAVEQAPQPARTLAEEASLLPPTVRTADTAAPPPGLVRSPAGSALRDDNRYRDGSHTGAALENLEFIGSSRHSHSIGMDGPHSEQPPAASTAPPPALRATPEPVASHALVDNEAEPEDFPPPPVFGAEGPAGSVPGAETPGGTFIGGAESGFDMDIAPAASLSPVAPLRDHPPGSPASAAAETDEDEQAVPDDETGTPPLRPFSDSLITNDDYRD